MKYSQKIYKANIMILVLFIMFITSLLGLLISQYMQHLIIISGLFQDYYKAYYYTYGGLELGLTQTKYHGYGFEQGLKEDYVYNYFKCIDGPGKCSTKITIKSRRNPVADNYDTKFSSCNQIRSNSGTNTNFYEVSSGNAVIFPLFYDISTGFDNTSYADIDNTMFTGMAPSLYAYGSSGDETYIIKVIDEELNDYSTSLTPKISESDPYDLSKISYTASGTNKGYLIFANQSGETKYFCLEFGNTGHLVSKYILIESQGEYTNVTTSLSAIKTDQLPSFLVYGTISGW